jgi:hypothetical protein
MPSGKGGGVSINPTMANVPCTPHRAPADGSTDMTSGGSGHADTINSYPTSAACHADLRGHAVRLMKRRDRHGLHRCCEDQSKSNSDQPEIFLKNAINSAVVVSVQYDRSPAPARFRRTPYSMASAHALGNSVSDQR